jgi:hypothetical protein
MLISETTQRISIKLAFGRHVICSKVGMILVRIDPILLRMKLSWKLCISL